jgi:putative ABC transport system permease protein
MIGVTLVSGMIVAAETVNRTLDRQIGLFTAVDVAVGGTWNGWYSEIFPQQAADMVAADALPAKMVARLEAVPGVAAAARVGTSWVAVPSDAGELVYYTVSVADSPVLEAAINLPEVAAALEPGVILVDAWANESIRDPEAWSEGLPSGGVDGTSRQVWAPDAEPADIVFRYVEAMDALPAAMLAAPETIQSLGGQATVSAMWLKVASEADPTEVQNQIMATVAEASTGQAAVQVDNQAVQRAERRRAVDTMLLIGLALLAVSVVVALIGVSNTLSLSVIERRRETAVLRALGLTQGQTRSMLALEGIVMSGVAGLVGVALGTGFAFAAAGLVLGPTNGFALSFPPGRLAWVFGLTLLAGLAASALPGGRAARTAPARALTAL